MQTDLIKIIKFFLNSFATFLFPNATPDILEIFCQNKTKDTVLHNGFIKQNFIILRHHYRTSHLLSVPSYSRILFTWARN